MTTTNNGFYGLFGPKGSRTLAAVRRGGLSVLVELYDTSGLSFNSLVVTVPDPQSAIAVITTALANRRQVLGEDHPEAKMVRDNVAVAHEAPRVGETQAPPGQAQKALPRFDGLYRAEGGTYLRFNTVGRKSGQPRSTMLTAPVIDGSGSSSGSSGGG